MSDLCRVYQKNNTKIVQGTNEQENKKPELLKAQKHLQKAIAQRSFYTTLKNLNYRKRI